MVFKLLNCALSARVSAVLMMVCVSIASHGVLAQGKLYRYVNDEGTKVISSSIPPRYVGKGYEVLSPNGRVMQVIPPEPSPEDREKADQEKALLAEFEVLSRRYSSTKDIEAARDRRLASLDTNISILRGNISNLNSQIEALMSNAATYERAGKTVPPHIFTSIDELKSEVRSAEEVLVERRAEHQEIFDKFADDVETYLKGKALLEKQTAQYP